MACATWQTLADEVGVELTGSTRWDELAGWWTGQASQQLGGAPATAAPRWTRDTVVQLLHELAGHDDGWAFVGHPELADALGLELRRVVRRTPLPRMVWWPTPDPRGGLSGRRR